METRRPVVVEDPWAREGATTMTQEEAERLLTRLQGTASAAAQVEYEFLRLVGEFDAADGVRWFNDFKSVAHWVSYYASMAPGTAREHVRVARALRDMPLTSERMRDGALSYSKVREVTRLVGRVDEAELLDLALSMTASQLARTVRTYRAVSGLRAEAELTRGFAVHERDDGTTRLSITLPHEEAAIVLAALEVAARESAEDGAPSCRAEAMVDIAKTHLDGAPTAHVEDDHHLVVVQVDAATLGGDVPAGTCHVEGVGPIEPETASRLSCVGHVVGAIVGESGDVLALGRSRRLATRAQRRAIRIRDGDACQFPGCQQRRHLDAHHAIPWWAGGPTDVDNLVNLCRRHHTAVHEGGMTISRTGGAWQFAYPNGDAVCPLDPPSPAQLALRLADDARIAPRASGGFSLDHCVAALFQIAA